MSKLLVKWLSPAGKPGNLTIRQRTLIDADVIYGAFEIVDAITDVGSHGHLDYGIERCYECAAAGSLQVSIDIDVASLTLAYGHDMMPVAVVYGSCRRHVELIASSINHEIQHTGFIDPEPILTVVSAIPLLDNHAVGSSRSLNPCGDGEIGRAAQRGAGSEIECIIEPVELQRTIEIPSHPLWVTIQGAIMTVAGAVLSGCAGVLIKLPRRKVQKEILIVLPASPKSNQRQ